MQFRAIIIDDEQKGIDALSILVEKFVHEVKVVAKSTDPGEAIELIENYRPEIVFLDINMPLLNGFELLEKLNWKDFNLIFVTAHQEYALKALKNNAVDYLLKPIDHGDLLDTIERIKNREGTKRLSLQIDYANVLSELNQNPSNRMPVSLKSGIEFIDLSEIVYLESKSNYTQLYMSDTRTILTSKTLKEYEDRLCVDNSHFMRVHHSYIINLHKVMRYLKGEENILLIHDQKVPLSKTKKHSFSSWLNI